MKGFRLGRLVKEGGGDGKIKFMFQKFPSGGIPGWRSGLAPAFGPGRDPGDPGSNPTSGFDGAWSLLLPLPVSLPLSLCVTIINK